MKLRLVMRNAFIDELVLQAMINERIVLIVGDLGYSVVEPFVEKFPERFINAGVAEQNMMGIAAGMASEGYHVYVYSIANFPTFRCAEQIRNDVDYHNLPVTIVAVGGGLAYGNLGYSHHAVQDYGLMRLFPNMLICAPGDPMEVRGCMRYLCKNPQPSYLRLGKSGEISYHTNVPNIKPGIWQEIKKGGEGARLFLTTGAALEAAFEISEGSSLESDFGIHSLPMWGQKFKKLQEEQVNKYELVVTLEDHLKDGGFGSWLMECLENKINLPKIKIQALDSGVCGLVGKQKTLNKLGGLYETNE
jgi:transketolase